MENRCAYIFIKLLQLSLLRLFWGWQAWVLDASIGRTETTGRSTDVDRVIGQLAHIPTPIASREWLYDYLSERGYTSGLQHWLGSNLLPLKNGAKGYRWAFDITGAAALFYSYQRNDLWNVVSRPPKGVELHIVRAANSDRCCPARHSVLTMFDKCPVTH